MYQVLILITVITLVYLIARSARKPKANISEKSTEMVRCRKCNLNLPKSTARDVYAQIISDAEIALNLMNGQNQGSGYPKEYAANMLLSKGYMTLATNPTLQASGMSEAQYWQMAYSEASKVYGQYSLVSDYSSLFTNEVRNSSESIFELSIVPPIIVYLISNVPLSPASTTRLSVVSVSSDFVEN